MINKENSEAQKKADVKELTKEPLKEVIRVKTNNQAFAVLAQELLDLSIDLRLKGAPTHSERLKQLSDLAQEQLTEQGLPDKRREAEATREKKKVTTFRPVLDNGKQRSSQGQRVVTRFESPGKRGEKAEVS